MELGKISIGMGDRFAHQGVAQLRAIVKANQAGHDISPVWNKSNREHIYVHSHPADVRKEADHAVATLGFKGKYFVDADHINLSTVAPFVETADFFTLDVAAFIGKPSADEDVQKFVDSCTSYMGDLQIPGIQQPIKVTRELLVEIASRFLAATQQASEIYQYLVDKKGKGNFITEVSMDEVEHPQTPVYLFFILKMLADKGVPAQNHCTQIYGSIQQRG